MHLYRLHLFVSVRHDYSGSSAPGQHTHMLVVHSPGEDAISACQVQNAAEPDDSHPQSLHALGMYTVSAENDAALDQHSCHHHPMWAVQHASAENAAHPACCAVRAEHAARAEPQTNPAVQPDSSGHAVPAERAVYAGCYVAAESHVQRATLAMPAMAAVGLDDHAVELMHAGEESHLGQTSWAAHCEAAH